jgi:putative flippase GtrA
MNPYLGRVFSYLVAATSTWKINRGFTFQTDRKYNVHREWIRYLSLNAIGGGINYAVYSVCVGLFEIVQAHLTLGVAAGSISGLAFNFTASKRWVFKIC